MGVVHLCRYALGREDCNQHTYAAAFCALATAGRMDLVVREWDALSRARIDIGPVGASGLIKACCVRRDVGLALRLFDQLLRRRVTFNRYAYNCLVHLCAVMGRCDDALAVYNLMRLECDEESLPDLYTYSALVRAVLITNRLEMAQQVRSACPAEWLHRASSKDSMELLLSCMWLVALADTYVPCSFHQHI